MRQFLKKVRNLFVSGLVALLPLGATFYVLYWLYGLVDRIVGRETAFGQAVEATFGRWVPGMGIIVMIVIILAVGFVIRNVMGRSIHAWVERIVLTVPGIRKMYGTFKQLFNAVLDRESATSFSKVVLFEYPKENLYVFGLVTNENLGTVQEITKDESIMVYVPTSPNPLSGYLVVVPKHAVTEIDIPVEDALSMIMSSGSALPDGLRIEGDQEKIREQLHLFRRRKQTR
ncbi:DUF502 domain-containing protein [Candidatus Bipolaricaulota bacterium]|nr:DUF502 domain-containing protein [Candidatus Bipolaricaulota bacterium]